MKIRQGFVSNSSSSSFVCSICDESYEGWDGQYDVKHYSCFNGHEICGHCSSSIDQRISAMAANIEETTELLNLSDAEANELMGAEDKEEWIRDFAFSYGEIDCSICPICSLQHIPEYLEAQYLREKYGLERKEIHDEIRAKYKNLNDWGKR
jgi:hypothetical protein